MVITETYTEGLVRTYSDTGHRLISGDGRTYDEAIDPAGSGRTYTESEELVEAEEAGIEDYENALRELGVDV